MPSGLTSTPDRATLHVSLDSAFGSSRTRASPSVRSGTGHLGVEVRCCETGTLAASTWGTPASVYPESFDLRSNDPACRCFVEEAVGEVTASMKADNGGILLIRQATNPNPAQAVIYQALKISPEVMEPVRAWYDPQSTPSATSLTTDPHLVLVGTN